MNSESNKIERDQDPKLTKKKNQKIIIFAMNLLLSFFFAFFCLLELLITTYRNKEIFIYFRLIFCFIIFGREKEIKRRNKLFFFIFLR